MLRQVESEEAVYSLGEAIRAVRKRHGRSQAEFAELLGCSRNTVSRYELDELTPSRSMLLLILPMAEGDERGYLLDHLGLSPWEVEGLESDEVKSGVRQFEEFVAKGGIDKRAKKDLVREFAELALEVVRSPERPMTRAMVDILKKWVTWRDWEKARDLFEKVAVYLDIELKPFEVGQNQKLAEPLGAIRSTSSEGGSLKDSSRIFEKKDPRYDSAPLHLMAICPEKKQSYWTGVTISQRRFDMLDEIRYQAPCQHCGITHTVHKKDVFLALPASE